MAPEIKYTNIGKFIHFEVGNQRKQSFGFCVDIRYVFHEKTDSENRICIGTSLFRGSMVLVL